MVDITQLPSCLLWDNAAPLMQVVNNEDLLLPTLMQRIGAQKLPINVAATSNRKEILRRQALLAWIDNNPSVKKALRAHTATATIPTRREADFMQEFHPERSASSAFMEQLQKLKSAIEASDDLPASVNAFIDILCDTMNDVAKKERTLATQVTQKIKKAAELSGVVTYHNPHQYGEKSRVDSETAIVSGYRLHCLKPLRSGRLETGAWAERHPILSAPWRSVVKRWNRAYDQTVYGGQIVDTLPKELAEIIKQAGDELLQAEEKPRGTDWQLTFAFTYRQGELRIKLIDLHVQVEHIRSESAMNRLSRNLRHVLLTSHPGYTRKQREKLEARQNWIDQQATGEHLVRLHQAYTLTNLPAEAEEYLTKEGKLVKNESLWSETLQHNYGWYALAGILEEDSLVKSLYHDVLAYRKWVTEQIQQMQSASQLLANMWAVARGGGLPLTIPKVLDAGEHMIRFESIYPTQLIGHQSASKSLQGSDLSPIQNFTDINGSLVILTGHNAGGKTVTLETLAETVYLAQCGLPVFGQGVSFNPKTALAVVFIERGAGSTAELLLRKTKATLAAVTDNDPTETLVILDELGTGTQEVDGDQLARKVLAKLQRIGCSTVCSTQITSLAQFAKDELNALTFQIDRERQITPGIGGGDVVGLAERVGLDEFLD